MDIWVAVPIACAVCGSFSDESRWAFSSTAAFMTFLPLLMIGGGAWYLWRRYRELEALELAELADRTVEVSPNA